MSYAAILGGLAAVAACTASHDFGFDPDDSESGSDSSAAGSGRALTYYADVKPIIDANCLGCHVEGGIGPLKLTTYDEVARVKQLVALDVAKGVMPPWRAYAPRDTYVSERRLTSSEKDTIVQWVEQGAPEGDPADEPEPEPVPVRGLSRVDGTMRMPEPFTPITGEIDEYRCFPLEWPYQETKYVTGLSVEPDKSAMVHHGVLYFVQPENTAAPLQQDAEAEGPGYPCTGVSAGGLATWLTSYEPGGYGQDVPGGLGFEVRPGSLFILQMHYNTRNGAEADQSRVDFKVEDHVDKVGNVALLMNPLWIAGAMRIPAGEPDVPFVANLRPRTMSPNGSYNVWWVDLHMHVLGHAGSIGVLRANGGSPKREPLLTIPKWAFEWQETYVLREPVRVNPGDQLYVECRFDNTAEHQLVIDGERLPPRDVNWGDHTSDEMCLGAVLIGPAD